MILLARNPRIVAEVHKQMATGQAQKTYFAVVNDARLRSSANIPNPTSGSITTPLLIDPHGHVSIGSPEAASTQTESHKIKPARTTWEVLASSVRLIRLWCYGGVTLRADSLPPFRQVSHQCSLMQLGLETGYKHQLRVHLAQALECACPKKISASCAS